MVKESFFLKKVRGIVFAALLVFSIFTVALEARDFKWDNINICTPTTVCGTYVYVWTLQNYCSVVSGDCAYDTRPYDQVPGGKGISVPLDKQDVLKKNNLVKIRIIPESYSTTSIKITKENIPVPYETKFVSVVVAYERETIGPSTGKEVESSFSNRVMWETPKELGFTIKISEIDLDTGDITILIVSNE